MTALPGYAPFPIASSAELGFTTTVVATDYGNLKVTHGDRQGARATIYLHGAGGSWATWAQLMQARLAAGLSLADTVLVDLPGFGNSQNLKGSLWANEVGSTVIEIARDMGWEEWELVGHSMGGFLALAMASDSELSVASVTAVSGSYLSILNAATHPLSALFHDPSSAVPYLGMRALAHFGSLGKRLAVEAEKLNLFKLTLKSTIAHPDHIPREFYQAMAEGIRPQSFVSAANNARGFDPQDTWGRIRCPAHLVFGANDALVPPSDGSVALPMFGGPARSSVILDCGHFSVFERPIELLETLCSEYQ